MAMARPSTLVWFVLLTVLAGCFESDAAPQAKFSGAYPMRVVCTTGMVADLARNVGGSHVKVTALM